MTLRQLVVAKDVETIQGTWRVVSLEKEGRAGEDDTWIIQKNKILFKRDNIVYEEAAYETDSRKRPPTIDFTFATGPAKGETIRGIYLLDKDRLKICYVAPDLPEAGKKKRPTEFSSKPGSGTWLLVLSRVKP
ncbi:MAG TPA: TIGR03067 domain-containing protein [Gemmataceae bacterium]|jgi:uncharacterized protein (TIGR03067 family)|nr:TIGR03067 domain-containing protein [Gemmataceae bacterium]